MFCTILILFHVPLILNINNGTIFSVQIMTVYGLSAVLIVKTIETLRKIRKDGSIKQCQLTGFMLTSSFISLVKLCHKL